MRVLIGHNSYQWQGGEDAVALAEAELLRRFGHEVYFFKADNQQLNPVALYWSKNSYSKLVNVLKEFRPQVAHFHNIYYALTPSVYQACHDNNVAVVQSLHNFRMFCANGLMFKKGQLCRKCLEGSALNGIWYGCFKNNRVFTAAITSMTLWHRLTGTFNRLVDQYITATEFTKDQYVLAGLNPDKINIKSNVYYPDYSFVVPKGEYALYIGRLSHEKGVELLIDAFKELTIPLRIIGDGPLRDQLQQVVVSEKLTHIQFLGKLDDAGLIEQMRGARLLVVPSTCYENFPRVVVEGYAFGLPVVAFNQGSFTHIINDKTGVLVKDINAHSYARAVQQCWDEVTSFSYQEIRNEYERCFSPMLNHQILIDVYHQAITTFNKNKII